MVEFKHKEYKEDSLVRMSQLEILLLKLSKEQENRVAMIGRAISNLSSKIDELNKNQDILTEDIKNLQSELRNINSPLNKFIDWVKNKITKK